MSLHTGHTIPVLDKGYVRLVDHMGTDETIIEAARMSTGRGFEGWDKDASLLEYLYSNKHMTPFEMPELCLEVKAPIFVFREWHRHRTQSYNEFSARYSQMPNEHYLPTPERIQRQSKSNKQGSGEPFSGDEACTIIEALDREQQSVYAHYDEWVEDGLAKEVARLNTPVSRYSKMRAKTDLRNWLGFLLLRMKPDAQWEIRQYAEAVGKIVESLWPRTYALFLEYTFNAQTFSASELKALGALLSMGYDDVDISPFLDDKHAKSFMAKIQRIAG